MKKTYNKKSKEDKEREVNELLEKANEGIEKCFTSPEQFKELINYMSKFYNYSFRNTFLIQEQFKGALAVGSYAFWKEKGFTVNKGEKGIKILVPNRLSDYFINSKGEEVKLSKATPEEKRLIEQGEIEVRKGKLIFNQGYVFEVSQTNAKAEDLPKIFPGRWLDGKVQNYDLMYKAMENIAKKIGVRIIEPKGELGAVKGVSYPLTKEIALNPRNTQLQNVKTLIHELAHAKLHTMETMDKYTTNEKEFQAEMSAYVVCSYFGLDTSEYSFRYISSWTEDVELKDKEKLINEVREIVKEYICVIEDTLSQDKNLIEEQSKENIQDKSNTIEYDKSLYEVKDQETMNENNSWLTRYFNEKNIDAELGIELSGNDKFVELVSTKIDFKYIIDTLKEEIEHYNEDSFFKSIQELKGELEIYTNLTYFLDKDINRAVGHEIEELSYIEKNYTIKSDVKLEDGTLIKEGTSFSIEGFEKGDIKVKFEQRGEYNYLSPTQIVRCSDLSKIEDVVREDELSHNVDVIDRDKEYKVLTDIESEDGSFIRKGTSFLIEGFENGKYEVHFSNEEGNIYILNDGVGDGYYFTIDEIEKFSDLNIEKNNENEIDLIGESDDWKLTDRDYEEVSFKVMKNNIEKLMKENYGDFVRAIISIENNIDDLEVLDNIYDKYMDNDFKLINDKFEELKNELGRDSREMISADKEKEIRKKIREHEEWINSKGFKGKQLNLENENLSGMMLLNMDLRNANLKNADIRQCVIFADLREANLEGSKIDKTKWTGSNISKMTIEANKLNLIEYQLEQEGCKHIEARKSLKTNRQELEIER